MRKDATKGAAHRWEKNTNSKSAIPKRIETIFDILYLITVLVLGFYLLTGADEPVRKVWGIMAIVLVAGDAFHLIPRILAANGPNRQCFTKAMGIGKQITSITMTLFYLLLWHSGLMIFQVSLPEYTVILHILTVVRICLCLFPQNAWTKEHPSYRWGIYRNIPFLLQGLMTAVLFGVYAENLPGFSLMWLAILLSFLFYLPVVLYSHKDPRFGMFMLPKTCVYVWMICMGI